MAMSSIWWWRILRSAVSLISLGVAASSCGESLPARIEPQGTLEIDHLLATQGTGPGGIHIAIAVDVRNQYEETFAGQVDVTGNIHIWWKKNPQIEANIPVRERANLLLDPGERHIINVRWLLLTDDREDVLDMLDYSGGDVRYGVAYARPEVFVMEVKLTVFEEIGLLTAGPHEFTVQGWEVIE